MDIKTLQSGIASPSNRLDFTKYKAAIWANYQPHVFCEYLSTEWQAEIIAAYLIDRKIEAVIQQDIERKNAANKHGKPRAAPLVKKK